MELKLQKLITFSFLIYIFGFCLAQLLTPEQVFSELENRNLTTRPTFTLNTFLSGDFGEDFETYMSDQFPGRNGFIAIKSVSEQIVQKTENNGVYIGDNDYFLQKFESPDTLLAEKNQKYINAIAEVFDTYLMIVPTATKIHENNLPPFATPYDEKVYIDTFLQGLSSNVHAVNVYDKLYEHHKEYIYYKTDHHWTTLGAYYAYKAFCQTYGINTISLEQFNRAVVSTDFYGSLFSKGNFIFAKPDTMEIFYPLEKPTLNVHYVADNIITDTLYALDHLDKKDKYSVFLNNNHPIIEINTDVDNNKKILIIKDSYANAFIPFLTHHFEEIHILDLRFINTSIPEYMKSQEIEEILILYNVQNFSVENKLSLLVPSE